VLFTQLNLDSVVFYPTQCGSSGAPPAKKSVNDAVSQFQCYFNAKVLSNAGKCNVLVSRFILLIASFLSG
jgi:hypothetical protein